MPFIKLHLAKQSLLYRKPSLLQITHIAPLHSFIKNHQKLIIIRLIMAKLPHTSTAQGESVTPLLFLQPLMSEEISSDL